MKSIFILLGTLLLVATANPADNLEPEVLNQQLLQRHARWNYNVDDQGALWVAYYAADGGLYVRRPDGSQVSLGATDRPRALSGLAMETTEHDLSILWRDKLPQKGLYFVPRIGVSGEVSEPLKVGGGESEPLTRLEIARADGVTYFLWLGEKGNPPTRERYHLYFRYAEEDGKVLSEVQRVLPGIYPAWIVDGGEKIPVFTWTRIDERLVMAMRSFDRREKSFGPLVEITEAPSISPIFQAFSSNGRWFLIWLGHYGDGSELLLEGVYSDDQGQTWQRFAFENLRGLDFSRVDTAVDDKGKIFLAASGSWRLREPGAKADVYLIRSLDNGTTWSKPRTLRAAEVGYAQARFPSIHFGADEGTVIMAWEDWRDIRSNVYVNYSLDHGETWSDKAIPLAAPGAVNLGFDHRVDAIKNQGEHYHVVAEQYTDDTLTEHDLVLYTFTLDELNRYAQEIPKAKDNAGEAQLRERVKSYWQAMLGENYATTYELLDPFFREQSDLNGYRSRMGQIKYHSYEIENIVIQANVAKVQIKTEASVPEFKWKGKPVSKPKEVYSFVETWLFVADDWYRKYYEESSDTDFTRY